MRKSTISIILFLIILILVVYGYNHIKYIEKNKAFEEHIEYIDKEKIYEDLKLRINKEFKKSVKINDFKFIKEQNIDNKLVILYTYNLKREYVGCAIYEIGDNGRCKFEQNFRGPYGNDTLTMGTSKSRYLVHFGYINDDDTNLFEIKIGENKLIKEYKKKDFFIEFYDVNKGGVTITPIRK